MGFWRGAIILSALASAATVAAGEPARSDYGGDFIVDDSEQADRPRPRWHQATAEQRAEAEAALVAFDSPTLTRFASEDEFRRYLGAVLAAQRARHGWYAGAGHIQFAQAETGAQSDAIEPICPETDPQCGASLDGGEVGHGHRQPHSRSGEPLGFGGQRAVAAEHRRRQSRHHQQPDAGVEEGDIVKQIDQYLLVLQDGRIFVIDTRAGNGRRLALADRVNVYRDPNENMWYDEMLVFGDRVLITGYSYRQQADRIVGLPARHRDRAARPRGRLLHDRPTIITIRAIMRRG